MGLPNPIPDNPLKWEGWKNYASTDPYERLCLDFESNPTTEQIEESCRLLLIWWQKKLPLKNQPSNPLAQLLRNGLDDAPAKLAEARSVLLDPKTRADIDRELLRKLKAAASAEFNKFLSFTLTSGELATDDEESLYQLGGGLGLSREEMRVLIDDELDHWGMKRVGARHASAPDPEPGNPASIASPEPRTAPPTLSAREEFLRMLRLSGIDELTDDQRDAFCNMGEALGMSGGDAEDIIDEYLEERMLAGIPASAAPRKPQVPAPPVSVAKPLERPQGFVSSPLSRAEEKQKFANFTNMLGGEMLLVASGSFMMGSESRDASPNEQPVTKTNVSAFYLARRPITNAEYERFDPAHRSKRAPWANDTHPVVYVSFTEAMRFCDWLSAREKRKYRLPTEAEWEFAARGADSRIFPWGDCLDRPNLANFADRNKNLPWADESMDTGFSATSPVGSFPAGASPFGMEDMAGNVWEWCLDCMMPYPGKERTNPRGPMEGSKRIYRGGSWKSRPTSLRASTRNCNASAFSSNDVGFRILCECSPK
ncbi:MAG: formylglycine-generating enzyme family protein [Verrucomicrobiota bacterium]